MKRLAPLAFVTMLVLGCATARPVPPTIDLRVTGSVPDATIWIDDHMAGRLSDFSKTGKRIGVGFHRVEIRAPGYYSVFQEVDAKPGADLSIHADLHELLP